jgi:ABC-type amino acid transport substrate-binding protein
LFPLSMQVAVVMIKKLLATLVIAAISLGSATAQTGSGTLGKIKAAKTISVAFFTDSLPFSFAGTNNEPAGYLIDLCKGPIAPIGRADLECADTTQTQSRLADVDFSNLISMDGGGLLVMAGSPLNQIADLAGKRVAVLQGTTTETRRHVKRDPAPVMWRDAVAITSTPNTLSRI